MQKQTISIIIVNWNGKHFLKRCFQTLFSQNYKNIEVIFVDNGSIDGSVEFVKKQFPKVNIITNQTNLGFAEANNIGYKRSKGEYVLFLNNDTYVTKNFLTNLLSVMKKDKTIGGVQSKILLMEDKKRLDLVGSFFTQTGFLFHYGFEKFDSPNYDIQIDIFSAKGAAMLFRRNVLEMTKVDGDIFDKNFFAYFEETDLCNRVWMAGYRVVFVPASIIFHKMGATSSRLENSFVQFHSYKNRINSYLKNLQFITLIKLLFIHLLLCELGALVYLLRGKIRLWWAINMAIIWNVINLYSTLRMRGFIQKEIRRMDDNKFLPKVTKAVPMSYYYYVFTANLKRFSEISL